LLIQITVLQKEVEILKRSNEQRRFRIKKAERVILAIMISIFHIKDKLSIIKPESVLRWQRELIKSFWTFKHKKRPHQGLDQDIPDGYAQQSFGRIHKIPIFGGLCHHYQRKAA